VAPGGKHFLLVLTKNRGPALDLAPKRKTPIIDTDYDKIFEEGSNSQGVAKELECQPPYHASVNNRPDTNCPVSAQMMGLTYYASQHRVTRVGNVVVLPHCSPADCRLDSDSATERSSGWAHRVGTGVAARWVMPKVAVETPRAALAAASGWP